LPLATTMQPHDKGHQKVNIHKIDVTTNELSVVLNPLTARANILARPFLAINRQPLKLESCSNPRWIQQVF